MSAQVQIPNGEETIMVELTVKEAIALSAGVRFHDESVALDAKKKLKKTLENKFRSEEDDKVEFSMLEV